MKAPKVKGDTYYGKVAQNYETRRRKQGWWAVEQDEMKHLLDGLPKGLKVLDVPFGTGRFVNFYVEREFDISGLDASIEMVSQAATEVGENFQKCTIRVGSAMELPFDDEAFDLLVSTRFLRDIITFADARKALAEFNRVTSKYAIIQLGQNYDGTTGHVPDNAPMSSLLSADQIDELLLENGFEAKERRKVKSDPSDNSEIFHILCEKKK